MKTLGVSQVDALFSNESYPIEFLFFYRSALNTERLRRALRGLSSSFWPAFGEYRRGMISFERYREEEHYEETPFTRELDIKELKDNEQETYSLFHSPELKKLFLMRVARFRNGMVLIVKMNHLAGDGYSYFFLLAALAALTRPTIIPLKSALTKSLLNPRHCRTVLGEFSFPGEHPVPPPQPGAFTMERVLVPKEDVHSIIRGAASSGRQRISTNDVLSAMAIQKLVGREGRDWGENVGLTIPIDVRRHISEFGPKFFGNAIQLHTLPLKTDPLKHAPVGDVAVAIRKSMPAITKERYVDYLAGLEKILAKGDWGRFRPFDPDAGCLVTNLSRLPAHKLDFGTGPPDFIFPLTVERNSAGILADENNFVLRLVF